MISSARIGDGRAENGFDGRDRTVGLMKGCAPDRLSAEIAKNGGRCESVCSGPLKW